MGKVAQLSVLTDDLNRPAKEIVWLIFNRWIQENDFNYIDKHMGMKQITSYQSIDYSELRDHLVDRQVPNELYVQKTKEGSQMHPAPKQRRIITEVLGTINASAPPMPDGSGRKVELRLTDKSRITIMGPMITR